MGKMVGGTHPKLFEEVEVSALMSKTHFARSLRAAAVKYEELTGSLPERNISSNEGPEIHGLTASTSFEKLRAVQKQNNVLLWRVRSRLVAV